MPSHFSTIGFPVQTQNEFHDFAVKAFKSGQSTKTDSGTYIQWRENNGAELWVQLDKNNAIIGMTPHFSGKANMRVGLVKTVSRQNDTALDGAFYGWADPIDEKAENGAYPFVFDSPDFLINKVNLPTLTNVQLAAFAHELKTYPDEKIYYESQSKPAFAAESFIPSGLFTPKSGTIDPPNAHAIFTGRVVKCSTFTNSFTGAKYEWALVHTLGGEIDVVIDPAITQNKISEGNILTGSFWLSGRMISSDKTTSRNFFERLVRNHR
jgi:hypothetical protein